MSCDSHSTEADVAIPQRVTSSGIDVSLGAKVLHQPVRSDYFSRC